MRLIISAMALAAAAAVMSPAREGGGEATGDRQWTLKEALNPINGALDPENDAHWNKGGQPELSYLQRITGTPDLKRADVVAAGADVEREAVRQARMANPSETPPEPPETVPGATLRDQDVSAADALSLPTERSSKASGETPAEQLSTAEMQARYAEMQKRNAELEAQVAAFDHDKDGRTGGRAPKGAGPATDPTEVLDARVPPEFTQLNANDPDASKRPPAAPTSLAMPGADSAVSAATPVEPRVPENAKFSRRWATGKGERVEKVMMVAIAVGHDGITVRKVGERFMFSGIPGSWMIPLTDPDLPLYLSGEKTPQDAAEKWGISIG